MDQDQPATYWLTEEDKANDMKRMIHNWLTGRLGSFGRQEVPAVDMAKAWQSGRADYAISNVCTPSA
ncbi:hypothetical protein E4U31_003536 [Claviceps sp. LM219 group G6]|nr:hypothetical protein E4U15_004264 [Claviceps sp. LM218 group G6]KAG6101818.1 hypothetical protein E4U31_003536 [Claviceps sp. LM219 group G6]KAG6116131.1 hypothetical protein E4U14_000484 [Claviceps sp. LM454 group G7]